MTSTFTSDIHSTSEALGLWEPKRTLTLAAARRHSSRIRIFRIVLLTATALLALSVVWSFNQRSTTPFQQDNFQESARMMKPRFSGRTSDGLPYKLTADQAIRYSQTTSEVELTNPILEFFREAGTDSSLVVAAEGTYDDVTQVLNLRTNVDLNTDDGNHCVTEHARIFTVQKRIEGDKPIQCTGKFGVISGQTYEILDDYEVFKFKNGVTAQLNRDEPTTPEGSGE